MANVFIFLVYKALKSNWAALIHLTHCLQQKEVSPGSQLRWTLGEWSFSFLSEMCISWKKATNIWGSTDIAVLRKSLCFIYLLFYYYYFFNPCVLNAFCRISFPQK